MEFFQKSILVAGMLITGTVNTLTKKVQNDCTAVGITGKSHDFDHAWFQTAIMFAGEAVCLIVFLLLRCIERQKQYANPSINYETSKPISSPWKNIFIFIIPTLCDVLGTSFGGLGLIWVPASVWQMMRGSIIIFSGILSVIFLKRKFYFYRWLGIGVVTFGLVVVGVSSMLSEHDSGSSSTHQLIIGLILIIIGQFFNALQMVLEEIFIKKRNFAPLQIVGMEGVWGLVLMSAIILPVMQWIPGDNEGSYENSLDAIAMIRNNRLLLAMVIFYWISIAFYNFCGLSVTKKLTAVHRTLVDALRTILVWGVDLFIFYLIDESFGESWNHYSYVQVAGFVLLLLGTTIYNAVLKIPGLYYEPTVATVLQEEKKPLLLVEDEEGK